ncbi:MAG: GntR family transcriptional regulator [Firmicutes bacterium]|nr:GntR family transcriptional regulator [Bacillota bacterium]
MHKNPDGMGDQMPQSDRIYEEVKAAILSGEIAPSTVLSQNELARQYDVSRSPVRDALRLLEQEGLVQLVPKVGALVKADDFSGAVEVTEIRGILEGYVAKQLAHTATYEDLKTLRDSLNQVRLAVEAGDLDAFFHRERNHHVQLVSMSRNRRLARVIEGLVDPLCNRAYAAYVQSSPEAARVMYEEHLSILNAIEEGDGSRAQALMGKHIQRMHAAMLHMAGYDYTDLDLEDLEK